MKGYRRSTYVPPVRLGVVYRCYDADGQLIYIGSTLNIKTRMHNHAATTWFYDRIHTVRVEPALPIAAARKAEAAAIFREEPLLNQMDSGRYWPLPQRERTDRVRRAGAQLPLAGRRPQIITDQEAAA